MAPLVEPKDGEDAALQGLVLRARAALQALSEGKVRTAGGLDSVTELQQRLKALVGQFDLQGGGIDLREVQESIVEHAAMYANCPEVLGGMLQLVFCLDHVRGWLEQRDLGVQDALSQLDTLQRNFEDCSAHVTELGMEVRSCIQRASTLEVELSLQGARSPAARSPLNSARGLSPKNGFMRISRAGKQQISVDLQALEDDEQNTSLEELRLENSKLHNRLAQAAAETAAACSAAEAAQNAAEQTASAAAQAASTQELRVEDSPLGLLEKLEPMLAGLPVGVVPGMSELQEEACEAYGRLRQLLIVAAAGEPAEGQEDQMPRASPQATMPQLPFPLGSPQLPAIQLPQRGLAGIPPIAAPLYTRRSTSTGTTEEPPDTWRATVISDPIRGIGSYGGTFGLAPPRWDTVQEHHGSTPWANRLC